MLNDLRQILAKSPKALIGDTIGVCAIGMMMAIALHVPSLV